MRTSAIEVRIFFERQATRSPRWQRKDSSANDEDLVAICRAEHKCLVTLDLDFGNPMRFDPSHYHGIAVLRLPFKSTASDLFDVVRTLALELADTTIEGKLWIVQRGRIREYRQSPSSTEA